MGEARILGRRAECARRSRRWRGRWGLLGREEGGKGASDGRRDVLIPRESGGRPVRAPCPMRGSRFPDAGSPSGRLLILYIIYTNILIERSTLNKGLITLLLIILYTINRNIRPLI